jgi:hypothetical protein
MLIGLVYYTPVKHEKLLLLPEDLLAKSLEFL